MKTKSDNERSFVSSTGSATFSGQHADQYEAMKHALSDAAAWYGEDGEYAEYNYLRKVPRTSLVVELVDALHRSGFQITKSQNGRAERRKAGTMKNQDDTGSLQHVVPADERAQPRLTNRPENMNEAMKAANALLAKPRQDEVTEASKPEAGSEEDSRAASGSAPPVDSKERVDMWDRPVSDPDTVSNRVRQYTAQWGLPQLDKDKGPNRVLNEPGSDK